MDNCQRTGHNVRKLYHKILEMASWRIDFANNSIYYLDFTTKLYGNPPQMAQLEMKCSVSYILGIFVIAYKGLFYSTCKDL